MKTCKQCQIEQPLVNFYHKKTSKDKLSWWCKTCHKSYVKTKYATAYSNPAFAAQEKIRIRNYYRANPEKRNFLTGAQAAANVAQYRSNKAKRTPQWLTSEDYWMMSEAYALAELRTKLFGFQWQVDHILPLRGTLVSGLHVPNNLQVIPAVDNRYKSNQFYVT